jgi:hypothetical protein
MHPIKDQRARLRVEKHEDGVDALVYLILRLFGEGIEPQRVHYV